jgi:drug/metabolite transporter (DMT)-like permease
VLRPVRTPPVGHPLQTLTGILLALCAVAGFATLDTTTKWVTASVPLLMVLWFRYLFQAVAVSATEWPRRGRALLRTDHPWLHVGRGLALLSSSFFAFMCLRVMPVGEFTAVVMITPLLVTLLSARMLGERVSLLRWLLVLGGFAGTLVITRPGGEDLGWNGLLALGLVASTTGFQLLTSRMSRTEHPMTMQFYSGWIGALIATLPLPWVWADIASLSQWAGLITIGVFGTLSHYLLILAYQRAPAATLMPYLYAQIGFAMFGGWLVFSHVPDALSLLGMAMIAGCGALGAWLTLHERRAAAAA